jgi:hypothetical protein
VILACVSLIQRWASRHDKSADFEISSTIMPGGGGGAA